MNKNLKNWIKWNEQKSKTKLKHLLQIMLLFSKSFNPMINKSDGINLIYCNSHETIL